jgi:carbamoyl-phosphate synthase small subunit
MTLTNDRNGLLRLDDGTEFKGISFSSTKSIFGEVVFNTGLVGYTESFTDPSYRGQILVLTYPLIGNYGVPERSLEKLKTLFESSELQIAGLIVSEVSQQYSHWNAFSSLPDWLKEHNVPALAGVDTRMLTKILRENGTMLGSLTFGSDQPDRYDPNQDNLVAKVSVDKVVKYDAGDKKVVLVDCGCKNSIITGLTSRGLSVIRVPWDYDFTTIDYDGIFVSNGPGDPKMCSVTINNIKKAYEIGKPVFGICLGNQLISLAAGADTFKLKYGHRSQNQPCLEVGSKRCYITSQNHGFAVGEDSIPSGWNAWFKNANDGTIEGIRHESKPFMGVQFHPEARPGPTDTYYLFDEFAGLI